MGKLNFNECEILYNSTIISLEIFHDKVIIKYDFNDFTENYTKIKFVLNAVFIQNLALTFESKEDICLKLEIRKGEQNFIYRNIIFNIIDSIIIPLEEFNPYTSSIDLIIPNNHKSGLITIKKSLE